MTTVSGPLIPISRHEILQSVGLECIRPGESSMSLENRTIAPERLEAEEIVCVMRVVRAIQEQ